MPSTRGIGQSSVITFHRTKSIRNGSVSVVHVHAHEGHRILWSPIVEFKTHPEISRYCWRISKIKLVKEASIHIRNQKGCLLHPSDAADNLPAVVHIGARLTQHTK